MWIGYADSQGTVSERIVEPTSVEGGVLTGYDHRSQDTRTPVSFAGGPPVGGGSAQQQLSVEVTGGLSETPRPPHRTHCRC